MATTNIPRIITRSAVSTIWYDRMATAMTYKKPLTIQAFTTLNEKLGINQTQTLPANTYPSVAYLAIGDKGHYATPITNPGTGAVEDVDIETIQHAPHHGALYNQRPFVVRAKNNDLTSAQRSKYALRKKITVSGVDYYAYYLKRLDLSTAEQTTVIYSEVGGVETADIYTPDASTLNPSQIIPDSAAANNLMGTYIRNAIKYTIAFDSDDMQEYVNACTILGVGATSVKITELAICQGLDFASTVDSNGSNVPFTDAIAVQIAHYAPVFEMVKFSTLGFNVVLLTGMNRPLFVPEQVVQIA